MIEMKVIGIKSNTKPMYFLEENKLFMDIINEDNTR